MRNYILDKICIAYGLQPEGKTQNEILGCIVVSKGGTITGDEIRNELLEKIKSLL